MGYATQQERALAAADTIKVACGADEKLPLRGGNGGLCLFFQAIAREDLKLRHRVDNGRFTLFVEEANTGLDEDRGGGVVSAQRVPARRFRRLRCLGKWRRRLRAISAKK